MLAQLLYFMHKKTFFVSKGKGKAVSVYEPPLFQGLLQGYKYNSLSVTVVPLG